MDEKQVRSLVQKDLAHFIHPQYYAPEHQDPLVFVSGQGKIIRDARGKEFIDGL